MSGHLAYLGKAQLTQECVQQWKDWEVRGVGGSGKVSPIALPQAIYVARTRTLIWFVPQESNIA